MSSDKADKQKTVIFTEWQIAAIDEYAKMAAKSGFSQVVRDAMMEFARTDELFGAILNKHRAAMVGEVPEATPQADYDELLAAIKALKPDVEVVPVK